MENIKGYLYITVGSKYLDEAIKSVRSLKTVDPGARTCLITDENFNISDFDEVLILEYNQPDKTWKSVLLYRLHALLHTPFLKTIFLDSDTFLFDSCDEVFDILDYYDLLLTPAATDITTVNIDGKELKGYYPYNAGVIGYRLDRTQELIKRWITIYTQKFDIYGSDQTPLMEALLYCPVNLYSLSPIYNFRLQFRVTLPELKVKIVHGRSNHFEKLEKVLNGKVIHRSWDPKTKKMHYHSLNFVMIFRKIIPSNIYTKLKNLKNRLR